MTTITFDNNDIEARNRFRKILAEHPDLKFKLVMRTESVQYLDEFIQQQSSALLKRIGDILINLGILSNLKGYDYLKEAIKVAVEDPSIVKNITSQLYPIVAETFQSTSDSVEAAIRRAIEVSSNLGKIKNINNIFGMNIFEHNDKPSNSEFIALIAEKLMIDDEFRGDSSVFVG